MNEKSLEEIINKYATLDLGNGFSCAWQYDKKLISELKSTMQQACEDYLERYWLWLKEELEFGGITHKTIEQFNSSQKGTRKRDFPFDHDPEKALSLKGDRNEK